MRVALVDLLTMTPPYDRCLAQALYPLVDDLTLYAITFHMEPSYFADLTCKRSPGAIDLVSKLGTHSVGLRRIGKLIDYLINWTALLLKFQRHPPDVLHVQWLPLLDKGSIDLGFVARAQRLGIPFVYTMHNLLPHSLRGDARVRERYARVYRMADALIVHTAQDRENLIKQFQIPQSKIFEIKLGPADSMHVYTGSQEEARALLGWDNAWFTFLMLGVIRPYKGIEEALRALSYGVARFPHMRLVVAGQGDSRYILSLQALAKELGVADFVIWKIGFVPTGRLSVFYKGCDIAFFPYRDISQSGALLAAAGLGCCALAANVGGLSEVIRDGETGIIWPSKDIADLSERMVYCMQLPAEERRRLAQALRTLVLEEEYNWSKLAAQTVCVYDWVLSAKKRPHA